MKWLKDERFKDNCDIHKPETLFTYKLHSVKELFSSTSSCLKSDPFYAIGIPWCMHVQIIEKKPNKKMLSFYLRPLNTFDSYINWNCKAYYELRILSGSPYVQNKVKQCLKTFTNYNYLDFCLSEELNNLGNFVRNDAIYLQCYLKAERISRSSFQDLS